MRLLKEPLLHFALAGAMLFAAYSWLNPGATNPQSAKANIRVSAGDVQWLAENWTTQWRRPPTQEELRGLITDYLNEQLLAREARALVLEDNDVIVRRRLAQKLTFLIDDTLRRTEPSERELQQFYEDHMDQFPTGRRISFAHIYFNRDRRGDAHQDAADALKVLREMPTAPPPPQYGDRLLIDSDFQNETEQSISGAFGPNFARAVFSLAPGAWSDPIESGFGLHLVRVSAVQATKPRPLSEVRARVVEAWRNAQEKSAKERYLDELRKKYDIVMDDAVKRLVEPKLASGKADQ
jgi:PPIC-type PPIASE domain